ncbi:glutamate receptor 1-like [Acanthaster planci]|uniref:Glutamate receptor 1-like n=1 Tax=Acanthaster planci TaxID=133434 RepID=A0A8B7ZR35_ACAPL|nr:glutamate receptor 1-like [Acanthaster planci]
MLSTSVKVVWGLLLLQLYVHRSDAGTVAVSALFGTGSEGLKSVIEDGVRYIKRNTTFLSEVHDIVFRGIDDVKTSNSVFSALNDICNLISAERPSAMILPEDKCSECEDIAGIASHASNPIFALDHGSYDSGSIAFKMHPSPEDTNSMFVDILKYFTWRNFIIVHDGNNALEFLQEVLNIQRELEWNITAIPVGDRNDHNGYMELAAKIKAESTTNIFLFCSEEANAKAFLVWAEQNPGAQILNARYHWILGNIDMSLDRTFRTELEKTNVYMTRFGMNFTRELQYALPTSIGTSTTEWPMRDRLAFDAVIAVGHALKLYREWREDNGATGTAVLPGDTQMPPCPTATTVPSENFLSRYLKEVAFEGISGNVAFDAHGNRVNYTISIYSGQFKTLDQMRGEWTQNPNYWEKKWDRKWQSEGHLNVTYHNYASERIIKIVTIEAKPFLMLKGNESAVTETGSYQGNNRFEGYIIDLLERIKTHVKGIDFDYQVELVADGKFGSRHRYSLIWNGMVGDVVHKRADIAAGPLTVTPDRSEAVDFTYPFMSSGITIMMKHPNYVQHNPFRIMYPFGIEVWFVNLAAFFIISAMLFFFNYFDPYEWRAAAERRETFEENAENFSMKNSMWFLTSTMFLQSFDASPRSNAGRTLAAFWWVFTIIMVFLYLLNLTHFVTTNKRLVYTKTAEELLDQTEVAFGTVEKGSTFYFFKKSSVPEYQRLWQHMNTRVPSPWVNDIEDGIKRVRESNGYYAFIGEAGELSFIASKRPCDLLVSGTYITRTTYALAVQKDSPLRDQLSSAIESLRDTGVLEDLEREWWDLDVRHQECANLTTWERQGVFSLTTVDLQGVYYILLIGIILAVVTFAVESISNSCNGGKKSKSSARNGGMGGGMGGPRGGGGMSGPVGGGAGGGDEKMWI